MLGKSRSLSQAMYDRIASGQPNKEKISERRYVAEKPESALDNDVQVFYRKSSLKHHKIPSIYLRRHGERPSKMSKVKSYTRKIAL